MIENLKRLREPVAWIVLAVAAASMVLALVRAGFDLSTGVPLASAAQTVSLTVMNLTFVVLLVILAWVCVFIAPAVARAKQIVCWSAILVTVGTLLTLVGAIAGIATSDSALSVVFEFLGGILDIVLKGVGTVTLWLMYRGLRGGRLVPAEAVRLEATSEAAPPTVWAPDAASGAVWTSAAEAAAGAPASAFGSPGATEGWPLERGSEEGAEPPADVPHSGTSAHSEPRQLDES
ncbi:MAG: hypothetical protein ACK5LN_07730 [Propioniciclava sp.]